MRWLCSALACLAIAAVVPHTAGAGGPLGTGLVATGDYYGPDAELAYKRAHEAGARFIRIYVWWAEISPTELIANPRDPDDPSYEWAKTDTAVQRAVKYGLVPILDVVTAPHWAWTETTSPEPSIGPIRPSVTELSDFTTAVTARYSGRVDGLPRVRYWQMWNEPNLSIYLRPQYERGRVVSAGWYRAMTNAFYDVVHGANAGNVVIAGGTAPFGVGNKYYTGVAPLRFMRELLCMSKGAKPHPTCGNTIHFDVWSHHPYTSGGPTHSATSPDDVSIGDLPEMRRLLDAAVAAGHVLSTRKVEFWVTEFSWDSKPRDPKAVSLALHARWVAEGLYRMWQSGVSEVTWFNLRDYPLVSGIEGICQCGLWLRGNGGLITDTPKPALQAFRFPFVAFADPGGKVSYWGRTPDSGAHRLVIEQESSTGWVRIAQATAGRAGIFSGTTTARSNVAAVRARVVGAAERSIPFSLRRPPDVTLPCPFATC